MLQLKKDNANLTVKSLSFGYYDNLSSHPYTASFILLNSAVCALVTLFFKVPDSTICTGVQEEYVCDAFTATQKLF